MTKCLDPELAIIDPHLHLWDIPAVAGSLQEPQTFLVRDAAELIASSGHRITHTVYVEAYAMHRGTGPTELRSLGETEFANGIAAMAASGLYGPCQIADRIVGHVDLCLGDDVKRVLDQHCARAGERFCGVRMNTSFSAAGLFGAAAEPLVEFRLSDPSFITGARVLAQQGLSLDVWCLHSQLPQLLQLAQQIPYLAIILNHVGTPDLRGVFANRQDEAMAEWRRHMLALSRAPNVMVKLSGLGMDVAGPLRAKTGDATPEQLARAWKERVEFVVETFGSNRCMFASNYPAERSAGSYGAIWDAFKLLAAVYSAAEKEQLFRANAARAYHIDLND